MEVKSIYSPIEEVTMERFKVARYVMISPFPERDVITYMDRWAEKSGLLNEEGYIKRRIGWDFHLVTEEQKQFGLRGYVAAYIIPEDFVPKCDAVELAYIEKDTYAKLTITNPHSNSCEIIPKAYKILLEYAQTTSWGNRVAFEEEYDKDGVHYMDVFVPMN